MKRRRFFQYAGLGSAGFLLANNSSFAADLLPAQGQTTSGLSTFEFDTFTLNKSGKIQHSEKRTAQYFAEPMGSVQPLAMVAVPGGQFAMGAARSEPAAKEHEFPRHQVKLANFFISQHPVTQSQWAAVAALPKVNRELLPTPAYFQSADRPVESVSWLDAMEFCDRLSQYTGRRYQLPSEAQWEYACRAGTQTPFHTGETITGQFANYVSSYTYQAELAKAYQRSTLPVGRTAANAFGLHDMHGNVWEWCADSWHPNYKGAPTQGQAWVARRSEMRTIRGGSWMDKPASIRAASRSGYRASALNRTIGFRVVTT
jgi:formylglycine-generating enzyme required for sulfatase activity